MTKLDEFLIETGFNKSKKFGEGIKIGIIDTGVSASAIASYKSIIEYDKVVGKPTENLFDASGHGTGLFKAIEKIVPNAQFCIVKALDDYGYADVKSVYKALILCKHNNVDIVVMSFSSKSQLNVSVQELLDSMINDCKIIMTSSLGNDDKNIKTYPSGYEGILSVGAVDSDLVTRYPKSTFRTDTDAVAIGKTEEVDVDGTSLANAIFAGQIALLLSDEQITKENYRENLPLFYSLEGARKLNLGLGYLRKIE